jgi:hypothetical protein
MVDNEHKMLTEEWIDNKVLHFIHIAVTIETVKISQRVREKKVDVSIPMESLRSNFSLDKRHSFHKYNIMLFLFLCNIELRVAWVYYK